jgi:hypothetical protein
MDHTHSNHWPSFRKPIHVQYWEYVIAFTGPLGRLQYAAVELIEAVHSPMRYRADPNGEGVIIFRIERSAYSRIRDYASRFQLHVQRGVEYTDLFSDPFTLSLVAIFDPPVWNERPFVVRSGRYATMHPTWYVGVDTLDYRLFALLTERYHLSATSYATANAPLTYFQWPYDRGALNNMTDHYGVFVRRAFRLPHDQAIAKQIGQDADQNKAGTSQVPPTNEE